jgi:hypothetical protein
MGAWEGMAVWCRRDSVDDWALSMPGLRRTMIAIEKSSSEQAPTRRQKRRPKLFSMDNK